MSDNSQKRIKEYNEKVRKDIKIKNLKAKYYNVYLSRNFGAAKAIIKKIENRIKEIFTGETVNIEDHLQNEFNEHVNFVMNDMKEYVKQESKRRKKLFHLRNEKTKQISEKDFVIHNEFTYDQIKKDEE